MLLPGENIGPYTIERELGAGGMATVFAARHAALGHAVAIKLLHPHLRSKDNIKERFLSEARLQWKLRSPHIVKVHDVIEWRDIPAIVMDLIDGRSLAAEMDDGETYAIDDVVEIAAQVLKALEVAHSNGAIHRDVKPDNILRRATTDSSIEVLLADFGIAKLADGIKRTGTGRSLGTVAYMSPEQVRNSARVDARTDLYSLGVTVWELLSGEQPYGEYESSDPQRAVAVVNEPLGPLPSDVPRWLAEWVSRMTAKDPAARFADAGAARAALEAHSDETFDSDDPPWIDEASEPRYVANPPPVVTPTRSVAASTQLETRVDDVARGERVVQVAAELDTWLRSVAGNEMPASLRAVFDRELAALGPAEIARARFRGLGGDESSLWVAEGAVRWLRDLFRALRDLSLSNQDIGRFGLVLLPLLLTIAALILFGFFVLVPPMLCVAFAGVILPTQVLTVASFWHLPAGLALCLPGAMGFKKRFRVAGRPQLQLMCWTWLFVSIASGNVVYAIYSSEYRVHAAIHALGSMRDLSVDPFLGLGEVGHAWNILPALLFLSFWGVVGSLGDRVQRTNIEIAAVALSRLGIGDPDRRYSAKVAHWLLGGS